MVCISVVSGNLRKSQPRAKVKPISYRYQAKHVYFVASADILIEAEVLLDGQPLGSRAGKDVVTRDGHSYLKIQANQLYEIIADQDYGQHTLEILIPQGGLQAYTFTFG